MSTSDNNATSLHGELVAFLTDNNDMRKCAKNSVKASVWAGGGAFAGAFLMGPVGGMVGGIAGSVAGFLTSDQYDGALQNISALEDERRKKLINEVTQVLIAAGATANSLQMTSGFGSALREYAQQDSVRDGIWRACINSLES
mmetsp:Transcript_12986/g.16961  ORF Transcript_12986/g.16961 Transcript_12986/m.16961 type:complete len:143 (-) Transcript_12986:704-1132(-)